MKTTAADVLIDTIYDWGVEVVFTTCVRYQLPVKVFVVKNNTLGMIRWEQMVFTAVSLQ